MALLCFTYAPLTVEWETVGPGAHAEFGEQTAGTVPFNQAMERPKKRKTPVFILESLCLDLCAAES